MKILVTGHRGFIGTHLSESLAKHEWLGYDLDSGDDILDRYKLEYIFETNHFDCIIHLASLTGARRGELFASQYLETNIIGTKNLVDLAEKYKVKKFIHFSSSSVLKPSTIYGMSKLGGEKIVERSEIPTRFIVRPFTVIGLHGRQDQVIYKFLELLKNGQSLPVHGLATKRNFTYVGDVVKFVMLLLNDEKLTGSHTYELCNPKQISLGNLLDVFKEFFPKLKFTNTGLDRFELKENVGDWCAPFKATPAMTIIRKIIKAEKHV